MTDGGELSERERLAEEYKGEGVTLALICTVLIGVGVVALWDAVVSDARYTVYVSGRSVECSAEVVGDRGGARGVRYKARRDDKHYVKALATEGAYLEIEPFGISDSEARSWLDACADAMPKDILK